MRRWAIGLWLAGLVLAIGVIVRTPFSTDMSAFLPRAPTAAQQMLVDQLREGVVSRMVLVAVQGPAERLGDLSRGLAGRLRADPGFALVANGDADAMAGERALLWQRRYLLSPEVTAERFTVAGLHAALLRDVALLGSDFGVLVKQSLPADPTGEILGLADTLAGRARPRSADGVWVSRDGTQALLSVSTRAAGFDIDAQEAGLSHIRAAFEATRQEAGVAAELVMTGPPVFAVAARARIKGDAERFSMIATALVAAVLLLAYRSLPVLVLGLLPVASGALAGIAAVGLVFGFVHGITLGFGVTLIGEAVDYAIYLFTQTPAGGRARDTLPRIWPILRLGMLTSVCGFSAMLFSHFTGFAQLGLFTIAGLVTALAVTRFVLPELLPVGFSAVGSTVFARPVLALVERRAALRWGVLAASGVAVLALASHPGPYWEDELSSMSPIPAEALAQDARLRGELGAADVRLMLVVERPTVQLALEASEAVAARLDPLVSARALAGYDTPARFLPSEALQRARQAALPAPAVLRDRLAEAVGGTVLRPDLFAPFLADVAAARSGALLHRADLDGTGLALQVDTLLLRRGAGWIALLPLQGVADRAAVERVAGGGVVFLDLKQASDQLLGDYRGEAVTLSLVGGLVIVLLLAVSLRSPARISRVLLPLLASVVCTAAIVLAGSGRLSIFNLFGLLLVVAVGSNYCLFFEGQEGARRPMVASLVLADLCTVIGFGILGFSQVPVLHGIGTTVAIGACLSLVFGAVLSARHA